MFSTIVSGAVHGIDSYIVKVEVDTATGMPCFDMVGFLGSEVKEARERVKVALKNSEIYVPPMHITINISPADIKKEGAAFDLPIAIGILTSLGHIPDELLTDVLVIGELGLNGEVKAVKGVLPIVMEAAKIGCKLCIVPKENALEAAVVDGIRVIGVETLTETKEYLAACQDKRKELIQETIINVAELFENNVRESNLDFADINGQSAVKRAVEIGAAGFHHILLIGPPGSGKTMIAKRISTILPPLSMEESLEVSKIYSVSGMLDKRAALITKRPFQSPHHTISEQALVGGGKIPKPGVISLAHRGVLFLDELPEFKRSTIDIMRQPLEDKVVHIARTCGNFTYPADTMLVAAMNPCPCGYYPDINRCKCTPFEVHRYISHISGPILDRIDISIEAPQVDISELSQNNQNETSEEIQKRVMKARKIQDNRYQGTNFHFNADLGPGDINKYCFLGKMEQALMERIFRRMNLSARAYHRIIKVARTIADLEGSEMIACKHLTEAACYRMNAGKY